VSVSGRYVVSLSPLLYTRAAYKQRLELADMEILLNSIDILASRLIFVNDNNERCEDLVLNVQEIAEDSER
jgi:hypothetical protein